MSRKYGNRHGQYRRFKDSFRRLYPSSQKARSNGKRRQNYRFTLQGRHRYVVGMRSAIKVLRTRKTSSGSVDRCNRGRIANGVLEAAGEMQTSAKYVGTNAAEKARSSEAIQSSREARPPRPAHTSGSARLRERSEEIGSALRWSFIPRGC
jgi:hypothetical protein